MAGETQENGNELPPLKITCTSTDCEKGRHCFLPKKPRGKKAKAEQSTLGPATGGRCRACNEELLDMQRIQRRDISDSAYTLEALQLEMIRHKYWNKPIDEEAIQKVNGLGVAELREATLKRLHHKQVCSPRDKIFRDGTQTPLEGDVIFYAQHATASCCRRCMGYWHGIPPDRFLTEEDIAYLAELMMLYLTKRLPDLHSEDMT